MKALQIHPTAVVDPAARLGWGTEVGSYAVIEEAVAVGERCWIGAHAVLKGHTHVGDDNVISEGTILGGIPQDLRFSNRRSYLIIGNRNIIRELVTISRATESEGETRIGNYNYI